VQVERNKTIILTIDVDYAFPSRIKGFIFAALGLKIGKDYLRNARIIARMINDSIEKSESTGFSLQPQHLIKDYYI